MGCSTSTSQLAYCPTPRVKKSAYACIRVGAVVVNTIGARGKRCFIFIFLSDIRSLCQVENCSWPL